MRLMRLASYLKAEGLTYTEFARRIGACNARTVERYAKGQRVPAGKFMAAISRESAGAVQPDDFAPEPAVALCGACELRVDQPQTHSCTRVDCPLAVETMAVAA
jgi:transcriptional regulator with XRE-family HTH domain